MLAVATCPDISYAVNYISQFLERPEEKHCTLIKRILRYVKDTSGLGIRYNAREGVHRLESYTDTNYASDPNFRSSINGVLFKYSGGAITWASKKQRNMSLSTLESEYTAASEGEKEAIQLNRMFSEIISLKTVIVLLVNNAGIIKLSKNPSFHKRLKHRLCYHFVRESVQEVRLTLEYIPSEKQAADILTKPIPRIQFEKLCYDGYDKS